MNDKTTDEILQACEIISNRKNNGNAHKAIEALEKLGIEKYRAEMIIFDIMKISINCRLEELGYSV
jgi:hypothetical protein